MKKLGTPIGDGPGSESENVGLLALGTPLPEGRFDGLLGFRVRGLLLAFALAFPLLWELPGCPV